MQGNGVWKSVVFWLLKTRWSFKSSNRGGRKHQKH